MTIKTTGKIMRIIKQTLLSVAVLAACVACAPANKPETAISAVTLTAADANEFLEQYASEMEKIATPAAHASWAYATHINFDTGKVNAYFNEQTSVLSA
jgi:peptidyl-dipeptidase A